jgi:hypothetical protein
MSIYKSNMYTAKWYEAKTTKGNTKLTRKYNGKYLNIVLTKGNHVVILFNSQPVTDTGIKYQSHEQVQKDVEAFINKYVEKEIPYVKPKKVWTPLPEPKQFGDNYELDQ